LIKERKKWKLEGNDAAVIVCRKLFNSLTSEHDLGSQEVMQNFSIKYEYPMSFGSVYPFFSSETIVGWSKVPFG